ncbi:MAG: acylphosphatase [Chloroflexi bacterium]|nr:acylphosphatase [Chloroflexota bacterium]
MKRFEATVHGHVQGVSFRYYTQREAQRFNLTGWVANQSDGTVFVVAEGTDADPAKLLEFLHLGAPAAYVKKVEVQWRQATGEFYRFSIRNL